MIRSRLVVFAASVALGASLPASPASAFPLTTDGKPAAAIVVAKEVLSAQPKEDDPTAKVLAAAGNLRDYVQKISGARLPIVGDDAAPQGPLVLVGRSRLTDAMKPEHLDLPDGLTPDRKEEGYLIACSGDRLVLAGNDRGPYHGTEYAVYALLRRLGVRWLMPGEYGEYVPHFATIDVPDLSVRSKPDFIQRGWWAHMKEPLLKQERLWKLRNGMNPDHAFAGPNDSSVRDFVADKSLVATKPELFARKADGSIDPFLPNLSNPQAVKIAADKMKEQFRRRPGLDSIGIAPDDGMPRDFSANTVARNQGFYDVGGREGVPAEASMSEEWITFVNAVAREVRQEFPDKLVTTNGYANRNTPPVGVRPSDGLGIMFAAIWSDTLHAYDDPKSWQMRRQGEMLREWCRQNPRVWVYNYDYTMLVSALTPVPLTRKLARDFPLMKQWGCVGVADEARNQWAECGPQTKYVRAHLLWDAKADVGALLDDYFAHWYGPAAKSARAFWDELEKAMEETPLLGHEDRILPYVYTPKLLAALKGHLEKAEQAAGQGDERCKLHVRADRLIYEHLLAYVAMNAAEFAGDFAAAAGHAEHMLALRRELKAIDPFLMTDSEKPEDGEYFYWGVGARRDYYRKLADLTGGKTGRLVALLPERTRFRTDPHDDGRFAGWYEPAFDAADWQQLSTTQPFYMQGQMDKEGHPYLGAMWYRFEVDVPALPAATAAPTTAPSRSVHLYAPVVETEGWCWVNGQYIGHRKYKEAYERPNEMDSDVTAALHPGARNIIAIRVTTGQNAAQAAGGLCSRLFLYEPPAPAAPHP